MSNGLLEVISEIESDINNIADEAGLLTPENFNARTDALDFIDFHIIDRIDGLSESSRESAFLILKHRADSLKNKLETVNMRLFDELQVKIESGEYRGNAFAEMVSRYTDDNVIGDEIGYDNLDIFINCLLDDHDAPETELELEPEMVFYQKTPARIVLELAGLMQMGHDDVFFDLGSGLGQVAILIHLITGAKTTGIEYDPAYCDYAKKCAQHFCLRDVEFVNTDARNADYTTGTVFFMYTPFGGKMLDDVLELLKQEAQKRPIRVFTYGPCSHQVAQQTWLTCLSGDTENPYKLCQFANEG